MSRADLWSLVLGAATTLSLSLVGIACGVVLGLALGVVRWLRLPVLGAAAAFYISLIRATPLITLSLTIFFLLPAVGWEIPAVPAAVLALAINTSAFNAEIWRAGLNSFPRDELDAARAFGMGTTTSLRRIVLPQLIRSALPALVNEMTIVIKNSPAVAVLGVVELTRAAVRIGADTYEPLPPLLVALGFYVAIVATIVTAQRWTERRRRLVEVPA